MCVPAFVGEEAQHPRNDDRVVEATFGHEDTKDFLLLVSRKNAPMGRVLRLPLSSDEAPALADASDHLVPNLGEPHNLCPPVTYVTGDSVGSPVPFPP